MPRLRTLDDIPVDGKRVIVRVDFNVSVGDDGRVDEYEDYRIEAALPTIQELQQRRCQVLILAHRGRPNEAQNLTPREKLQEFDMQPVSDRLEELLKEEVRIIPKLYGSGVDAVVSSMEQGSVAMYPNIRLDDREITNSEKLGREMARVADAYVNEAFSVSHRAQTSVTVLPRLMLSCAGRRTVLEVEELKKLQQQPDRPYVAIVSGAKITGKVGMLHRLLAKVDTLCVGGQIANVFLAAAGRWPVEKFNADEIAAARVILQSAGPKLLVPADVVVGAEDGSGASVVAADDIKPDAAGVWDIGPDSTEAIMKVCATAKTVMWNGPVGKFETAAYAQGTRTLAEKIAALPNYRVVGGGDTVTALETYHVAGKYDHVSVGGGAMVAYLEEKRMPGLEPLYS